MDIEKIENFLVFSEYMNFTIAANKVFMDPSVFHRQISSIENELGLQLIQRENRAMCLTPAGESFANGMKNVLELYHMEVQKAEDLNAGVRGTIVLCNVIGHALSRSLSNIINKFESVYPDIKITVIDKSIEESRAMLQKGYIDFAVARDELYALVEDKDSLEIEMIRSGIAIHASLLPQGMSCAAGEIDMRLLDRYPLIWCRDLMSPCGTQFLREREERLGPDSIIWVPDPEATYSYLELKRGFTLINDLNFYRHFPDICYFPIEEHAIRHSIVWKKTNTNNCLKVFTEFLQSQKEQNRHLL